MTFAHLCSKYILLLFTSILPLQAAWGSENPPEKFVRQALDFTRKITVDPGILKNFKSDFNSYTSQSSFLRAIQSLLYGGEEIPSIHDGRYEYIIYDPVFDVAIVTHWVFSQEGVFSVDTVALTTGEALRHSPVTSIMPAWLYDQRLDDFQDNYHAVSAALATSKESNLPDESVAFQTGNMRLTQEQIAVSRLAKLTFPIIGTPDQYSQYTLAKTNDFKSCVINGYSMKQVFECAVTKLRPKAVGVPKNLDQESLGVFLTDVQVETVVQIKDFGIGFIGSGSPSKDFRLAVFTRNGAVENIQLMTMTEQAAR